MARTPIVASTQFEGGTFLLHGPYGGGKTHLLGDMLATESEQGPVRFINLKGEDGYLSIMPEILGTAEALLDKGATQVFAACTHPVLSGPALERLQGSKLTEVVVTNTIPLNGKDQQCPKLRVLSVAPLLGEAIKRIHGEESVSSLFA